MILKENKGNPDQINLEKPTPKDLFSKAQI